MPGHRNSIAGSPSQLIPLPAPPPQALVLALLTLCAASASGQLTPAQVLQQITSQGSNAARLPSWTGTDACAGEQRRPGHCVMHACIGMKQCSPIGALC